MKIFPLHIGTTDRITVNLDISDGDIVVTISDSICEVEIPPDQLVQLASILNLSWNKYNDLLGKINAIK